MLGEILGGIGSIAGAILGNKEAKANRSMQKQAMYKGIQIKVKDAEAAGVHPLYALGAPTFQPTPISSGLSDSIANAG